MDGWMGWEGGRNRAAAFSLLLFIWRALSQLCRRATKKTHDETFLFGSELWKDSRSVNCIVNLSSFNLGHLPSRREHS